MAAVNWGDFDMIIDVVWVKSTRVKHRVKVFAKRDLVSDSSWSRAFFTMPEPVIFLVVQVLLCFWLVFFIFFVLDVQFVYI